MGERLSSGNIVAALLTNSVATGAALVALILTFVPISGAHFNPAVTLARTMSDTFAGISPADAPPFVLAQLAVAGAATALFRWLVPPLKENAEAVVVPHSGKEEGK